MRFETLRSCCVRGCDCNNVVVVVWLLAGLRVWSCVVFFFFLIVGVACFRNTHTRRTHRRTEWC